MGQTIVLVTCLRWPELSASDRRYAETLAARSCVVRAAPWNGPEEAFAGADVVVLRSNWDYHHDLDAFTAWMERVAARTAVLNPPALVRWNLHKGYLLDLERRGVAIPATRIVPPELPAVRAALATIGGGPCVLKPAWGASGHLVTLATAASLEASLVPFRAETPPREVVVQAFLPELHEHGEVSCVFFDGDFSHAAVKRPAAGEFRINSQYGGVNQPAALPEAIVAQAGAVLAALPERPLYARVDGVIREGRFLLMELELNEPGLFLEMEPSAADRFAGATLRRLTGSQ